MKNKKQLSILVILTMLVSLVLPMGTFAEIQTQAEIEPIDYAADQILVQYAEGTTEQQKKVIRTEIAAEKINGFDNRNIEVLKLKNKNVTDSLKQIKKKKNVLVAEPDYILTCDAIPNDPEFSSLWGLNSSNNNDIDAPEAWNIQKGSARVIVAVIDEGLDINHVDLSSNIWTNTGEIAGDGFDNDGNGYIDDVNGWDFFNNDSTVYDGVEDDHGTHVAGTIAAMGDNGIGVVGVAPEVALMPLKFLGPEGGYTSDAIKAIEYAKSKGAHVINASWGGGSYSNLLEQTIRSFPGVFVAAAGNSSMNLDNTPYYPACYNSPNIITVAAIDSSGSLAYYSNYGSTTVDFGAPGSSILSTLPGNKYGYKSGTSMATPHVTGVVALIMSHDSGASVSSVIHLIQHSSKDLLSLRETTIYGGLVNANRALTGQMDRAPWVVSSSPMNGSVQQPLGQPIIVEFNENVTIDLNEISLKAGIQGVTYSVTSTDTNLSIMPDTYQTDTQYTVTIPTDAVVNEVGLNMLGDAVIGFRTIDTSAPYLISSIPAQGASNVLGQNLSIRMNFSENIIQGSNFAGIQIADSTDISSNYTATIAANTLTLKPVLTLQGQVTVTIPIEAITDSYGTVNNEPIVLTFNISMFEGQVLPFKFTNALMDPNHPVIYLFKQYDNQLHIYNYETQEDQIISMNTPLVAMSFGDSDNNAKLYLALSNYKPNSNDNTHLETGYVSILNLNTLTEEAYFPLRINPFDIAVDHSGAILISSANNQWTTIESYRASGLYINSKQIRQQSFIEMHPTYNRLYTITTDSSPRDYIVYPVINGGFSNYNDSIYHGTHTLNENFHIDSRGRYLLNGSGVIYSASEDTNLDMRYVDQLDAPFTDVAFDPSGAVAYTLPTAREIAIYDLNQFSRVYSIPLFAPGKALFEKSGEVAVLMPLISASGLPVTGLEFFTVANVIPPQVLTSSPQYGQINVPVNTEIILSMNNDVQEGSTFENIKLTENGIEVPVTAHIQGHILTIKPLENLAFNADCAVTVPKGAVKDYNGLQFNTDFRLTFTTKLTNDNTAPVVISTTPVNGTTVAERTPEITINFDEAILAGIDLSNISLLRDGTSKMTITTEVKNNLLIIRQSVPFTYGTHYTLNIPSGAVTDLSGNPLLDSYNMDFTTMQEPDTTAPYVISSTPSFNQTGVAISTSVTALFIEDIYEADTFNQVQLLQGTVNVPVTVSLSGKMMTITPNGQLQNGLVYTVIIPEGSVKDAAGNSVATERKWQFTTANDTIAPTITATSPGKNAPKDSKIVITFSEDILMADMSKIMIKLGKTTIAFTLNQISISGNQMIIDLGTLGAKKTYAVTISAGTVKDLSGNLQTQSKSFFFTTVR